MSDAITMLVEEIRALRLRVATLEAQEFGPYSTLAIIDGASAPTAASGIARLFVDEADGDLKIIIGTGTTTSIMALP